MPVGVSVSDLHPDLTVGKTASLKKMRVIPHPLMDTGNPVCLLSVGVSVSDPHPDLAVGEAASSNSK